MKKIKKILAVFMAMAMIMGLGMTAFAANSTATITVSGLASTGTNNVTYYKILQPDVEEDDCGYEYAIANPITGYATAKDFLDAANSSDEEVVDALKTALSNAQASGTLGTGITGTVSNYTFTAEVEAGTYAVFITNSAAADDPTIVYNSPMIVSIEYTTANPTSDGYDYNAVEGANSSVVAKYTTIPVTKSGEDSEKGDSVVEIGGTASYTIETYIPSEVSTFTLTDTLNGATYQTDSVDIRINGVEGNLADISDVVTFGNNTMTIDLSDYVDHAGQKVTITYDVTVTGTVVGNSVVPEDGKHAYDSETTRLSTGAIQLKKYGVDEDADGLQGAVFKVYKMDNSSKVYLKETVTNGVKAYSWVSEAEASTYTTDANGIILIEGLDLDTYYFQEVKAPDGYSINTDDARAEIKAENTTATAETATPAKAEMTDTKLASLPSTGGIGTTIFTVGGCIIMIAAAGLFFASRRKSSK